MQLVAFLRDSVGLTDPNLAFVATLRCSKVKRCDQCLDQVLLHSRDQLVLDRFRHDVDDSLVRNCEG